MDEFRFEWVWDMFANYIPDRQMARVANPASQPPKRREEHTMTVREAQAQQCRHCGRDIVGCYKHSMVEVPNGDVFCSEECAREHRYAPCAECGEWHYKGMMARYRRDYLCSEDCAESYGLTRCPHCGSWVHPDDGLTAEDGTVFCTEYCAEAFGYVECHHCGALNGQDSMRESNDGAWFCDTECAARDGYVECHDCGTLTRQTDSPHIDDVTFCTYSCARNCGYERCGNCGHLVPEGDVDYDYHDTPICHDCRDSEYVTCDECGRLVHEDSIYDDYIGEVCHTCHIAARPMHEYGYVPELTFFGESATHPYLGIELEVDNEYGDKEECSGEVHNGYRDRLWMTRDGSLSSEGIELTSHPMTTEEHLSGWWEDVFGIVRKHDYTSHDNGRCGLHIHVNRSFFSSNPSVQLVAGQKLVTIMSRFKKPLMAFSRRKDDEWCRFSDMSYIRGTDGMTMYQKAHHISSMECEHSRAVNFEHRNTFELRIFRGTLRLTTFYASIALADAMARAAKHHSVAWAETVSWYEFAQWAVETCDIEVGKEALNAYLHEKGLIEEHVLPCEIEELQEV